MTTLTGKLQRKYLTKIDDTKNLNQADFALLKMLIKLST